MSIIWIVIIILLLLIEIMTIDAISMWYAIGAIVSLILTTFKNNISSNFLVQLAICIVIGTILLRLFRKKMLEYLKKKNIIGNKEKQIGLTGVVYKRITNTKNGIIKINNKVWKATSNKKLVEGTKVTVVDIDGENLRVKEKDE